MKTCKTCKHWGNEEGRRLQTCNAPLIKFGYGFEESDVADNGALVENDEGWGIFTGPEFGCVLHEDKEDE